MLKTLVMTSVACVVLVCAATGFAQEGEFNIPEGWVVSPENDKQPGEAGHRILHDETGIELLYVPAASFMMGSEDGEDDEKPVHEVELSGYWIGRTEVTVAQWREVMGEVRDLFENEDDENGPILFIRWHQAVEFCEKLGLRLPTEAEWEYAARGPEGRPYPWGDEWDPNNCVTMRKHPEGHIAVGSIAADTSWCGAVDMTGNVNEWCSDWYHPKFYAGSPKLNPTGPKKRAKTRSVRGASWRTWDDEREAFICRSARRLRGYRLGELELGYWGGAGPSGEKGGMEPGNSIGFRCAFGPGPDASAADRAADTSPAPGRSESPFWELPGNFDIYVMNADGSEQANLTNSTARDWHPAWSPDGTKIAFDSDRDGDHDIYVMDADGSNVTQLTSNTDDDRVPSWSPDGSKIAFQSGGDGIPKIHVMNADGSGQTQLTGTGELDFHPAWSPEGDEIAFGCSTGANWEIHLMNVDGSGQTNLTNDSARDSDPAWSPNGAKIAFASDRDGNWEIYVINADGSGQVRLTDSPAADTRPAWSPDGSEIAFESNRNGKWQMYVMGADGSEPRNLLTSDENEGMPIWSRDGSKIAFVRVLATPLAPANP